MTGPRSWAGRAAPAVAVLAATALAAAVATPAAAANECGRTDTFCLAESALRNTNAVRAKRGKGALTQGPAALLYNTVAHSKRMADAGTGYHQKFPDIDEDCNCGNTFFNAENVGMYSPAATTGDVTAQSIINLENSPRHLENTVNDKSDFVTTGVFVTADGGVWVTQVFGYWTESTDGRMCAVMIKGEAGGVTDGPPRGVSAGEEVDAAFTIGPAAPADGGDDSYGGGSDSGGDNGGGYGGDDGDGYGGGYGGGFGRGPPATPEPSATAETVDTPAPDADAPATPAPTPARKGRTFTTSGAGPTTKALGDECSADAECDTAGGAYCRRGWETGSMGGTRSRCRVFVAPCASCASDEQVCWMGYGCTSTESGGGQCVPVGDVAGKVACDGTDGGAPADGGEDGGEAGGESGDGAADDESDVDGGGDTAAGTSAPSVYPGVEPDTYGSADYYKRGARSGRGYDTYAKLAELQAAATEWVNKQTNGQQLAGNGQARWWYKHFGGDGHGGKAHGAEGSD